MATEPVVVYGPGGYDPSKPNNNVIATTSITIPPDVANGRTLQQKARQALIDNGTYLAIATPTAAQNTAQVKRLTRQVNALIRLQLNELADVTDT